MSWLPWSRGYLAVSAAPAGALITVDGVAKGAAPQVVEVEPGVLHRLQVSRDTYFTYVADLSSAAGTKTVIAPELVSQPGSISVSTSIPGARVRVDTSDWQDTPFVFEDVPAGVHTVEILSVRNGDGAFTAGPPFQVTVSPAQRLDVVKEMVRGQTHLTIRDAPPGSVVQITGLTVDSEQALTGGVDVPSGVIHLTITSPASQKWYGDTYLEPGKRSFTSIYDLTWQVPQRTISLDKGAEQWSGLVKAWNKGFATQFVTGQPGSQVSGGYLSMDDHSLYVRFEFEDGTPTPKLVRQIKDVLSYGVLIYTNHNKVDRVTVGIRFHGNGSTSTNFGVYNPNAQWTQLGGQISYRAGPGSLQVAIPLSSIKEYVKGLSLVTLQIDQENDAGYWGPWRETASCRVTFGF